MKTFFLNLLLIIVLIIQNGPVLNGQETEILYLSGTGNENTVDWEFFCTKGHPGKGIQAKSHKISFIEFPLQAATKFYT